MKISAHQVRAALEAYVKQRALTRANQPKAKAQASGEPVDGLQIRLRELPDVRELLVHNLRTRVRRGRYFVSSKEIVDALLGRLAADLLNQE